MNKEVYNYGRIFFSLLDRRWSNSRIDNLKRKLFKIGRNIEINASNLEKNVEGEKGYLLGRTLSIVQDNLSNLVVKVNNLKDKLGRQSSIRVKYKDKTIEIIGVNNNKKLEL